MEEKKEKKGIRCSYAVLVIVLFAALAFVTDYSIIERKTRKCDCPKCVTINNEVISDNTDNTQVTENKIYSYEEVAGRYVYSMDIPSDIYYVDSAKYELVLNPDGTCIYKHTVIATGVYLGNYIINGNKIYLNLYLTGGGSQELQYNDLTDIIDINDDNSLTDNNPFWGEEFEISSIKLSKDYSAEMSDDFNSIIKNNI